MGDKKVMDKETKASMRRAKRLKEVKKELEEDSNSELAKLLAEIEAKNNK